MSSCISVINNCLPHRELSDDEYEEFFDFADKVEAWKDQFKRLSQEGAYSICWDGDTWLVDSEMGSWNGETPQQAVQRAYDAIFND